MAKNIDDNGGFFGGVWNTVRGFFEIMFEKGWTGFAAMAALVWKARKDEIKSWVGGIGKHRWEISVNAWRADGWIDQKTQTEFLKLTEMEFPWTAFAYTVVTAGVWIENLKQTMYTAGADLRRKRFREGEPEDARVGEVLQSAFAYPETKEAVVEILRNNGYPKAQIDLMFKAFHRLYDENVIKNLFWRGVLDNDGLYKRMRNLGYTDDKIEEIVQGWPVIPGPGDLFHLVAKEAFEPDIVEHYGYAEEFPVEQLKWLEMQGLTKYWALRYWYAHWETPSIGQGYEMLHRGVIDWKELQDLFKTVEIPPFWRDKLTEIAYVPFTRVDVRRMHKIGVISDDELIIAYQDVGYSPEKAITMAEFTKLYNMGAEKDLTRTQITNGYRDDLISRQDAQIFLLGLGYDEDEVDYLIAAEDYEKEKELDKIVLTNIQNKFQKNLIDEFECRNQLAELNLEGERIELLVEKWKINIVKNITLPAKADLDKFVKAKIITDTVYIDQMKKLGFDMKYIEWYLKLAQTK